MPDQELRGAVATMRESYTRAGLCENELADHPVQQFERWFRQAVEAGLREPNAMTVATATRDGVPSARILLLKQFDERGFVFYSNHGSRKGREIEQNPRAALIFYWAELERQVRVTGRVERVAREESLSYFQSRPRGSQLGAWTSRQSTVIASRAVLEEREAELAARFGQGAVPLPEFWGGYRVVPEEVEFWQGRPNRLHDRLRYRKQGQGWITERLAP